MQSFIKQEKQCDRQHDEGQDKLIAICLNTHCDKRLMCCFCYHDYHCEHVKDVKTITQLQGLCKNSIAAFDKLQLTVILQNKAEQFKKVAHAITQQLNKLVTFYMDDVQQIYTMVEELAESFVALQKGQISNLTNEQCELLATFIDEKVLENVENVVNHIGEKMGIAELIQINDTLEQKLQLLDVHQILEKNILNEKLKQFQQTHEINHDWIQPQFLMIRSPDLQKIEYSNEDFYIGEIRDNKRFGRGLFFQKVAQTYQLGVFKDDNFLWGQQLMVVNKKYWMKQGKWVNGKIEGRGTHVLLNGEMYQGDLRSDIRDGFGIMKYPTGDEYQGQWRMGLFNGKGLYKYANGDEYEGDYVNDKKEGIGSYQYKNGELYVGQFQQGLRHGSAIVKFPNGDIYTGDYLNDKKDGQGVYRYANGNIFEGEYKNGVRHGNGFFTDLENETREVGQYVEGLQEGDHMLFKLLKDQPYSVNVYEKGKLVNSRSL